MSVAAWSTGAITDTSGGVPAYIVFSDATLLAMAASTPQNEAELLNVSGVGPTKLETYGEALLEVLRAAK